MWVVAVAVRSYLQVHQLELESLGQQIRENKRNGRLVRTSPASRGFFIWCCWACLFADWMLCDAKCSSFLWQGSLYEQDKVSFSDSLKTFWESFRSVWRCCFPHRAASEGHWEVHAPPGVPSQQGVCVCQLIVYGTVVTDEIKQEGFSPIALCLHFLFTSQCLQFSWKLFVDVIHQHTLKKNNKVSTWMLNWTLIVLWVGWHHCMLL